MTTFLAILLVTGLIFPALSWLTLAASAVTWWKSRRHASPVFIPCIGPILLTGYVLLGGHSTWIIPFVWLGDIGTVAFLSALPWMIREWWQTSAFTCIMTLRGTQGIQHAILTLHKNGHYLLNKSWDRAEGEYGIGDLGEPGSFVAEGDTFQLEAHHGLKRTLRRLEDGSFIVEEHADNRPELKDYSLNGWRLES